MSKESDDSIILAETHPSMYLIHKYWGRKPHNIISNYISKYTKEGDIILDPFSGSGVTVIESILKNRNAIGIDINPFTKFLVENTLSIIDLSKVKLCFSKIEENIANKVLDFYGIKCPYCKEDAVITHLIWEEKGDREGDCENQILNEIRINCRKCNLKKQTIEKNDFPEFYSTEITRIKKINSNFELLKQEYQIHIPSLSLKYPNGKNFRQLRHDLIKDPNIDELFTKRNLIVLGIIKKAIEEIDMIIDSNISFQEILLVKNLLLLTFTANLGQSSKMVWVISKRKNKTLDKKEVGSWTHHFFWNPSNYFEVNPWIGYKTRYKKTLRGKENYYQRLKENNIKNIRISGNIQEFLSLNKRLGISNAFLDDDSSSKLQIPDETIDYIFTDPPYGDSIQYYELSTLWNLWLDKYDAKKSKYEIIINKKQDKLLSNYKKLLNNTFKECFRVLKIDSFMTITFHNTDIKVRNSLILSILDAGFKLEGIVFQMPPRNSLKSYLHYKNSPTGDYYIKFKKIGPSPLKYTIKVPVMTELKMFILEKVNFILKSRGEPTNIVIIYTILDEYLIKEGFFPIDDPKLIDIVYEQIGKEDFIINNNGEWWFKNDIHNISENIEPLIKRIKKFLLDEIINLKSSIKKKNNFKSTYSYIYNLIYQNFNGILTPDRKRISELIEELELL